MTVLAELQSLSGVPLHPLLVHLPVVFVPLAFIGAIVALAVKRWRGWCLPLTAVFATIGLVGVQLAMMSGEGLEELLDEESRAIEAHAQLAEQARPFVFLFFVFAVLAAAAWHLVQRDGGGARSGWARALAPLMVLSILTGGLASVWVYRTGHSGAKSAWGDTVKESGKTEGGGEEEGDGD